MDDHELLDLVTDLPTGTELVLTIALGGISALDHLLNMIDVQMLETDCNTMTRIYLVLLRETWREESRVFHVQTARGFCSMEFTRRMAPALKSIEVNRP